MMAFEIIFQLLFTESSLIMLKYTIGVSLQAGWEIKKAITVSKHAYHVPLLYHAW